MFGDRRSLSHGVNVVFFLTLVVSQVLPNFGVWFGHSGNLIPFSLASVYIALNVLAISSVYPNLKLPSLFSLFATTSAIIFTLILIRTILIDPTPTLDITDIGKPIAIVFYVFCGIV